MTTDVFNIVDYEGPAGAGSDGGVELGDGGEVTAWEDIAADEVVGFGVSFISLFKFSSTPPYFSNFGRGKGKDLQIQEW